MVNGNESAVSTDVAPNGRKLTKYRRYKLARPALDAAVKAVDERPEFANDPESKVEQRVLAKLGVYREWLVDHGLAPPRSGQRAAYKEVLHAIGHRSFPCKGAVKDAILGLSDLLRQDEAFRHRPERPVDAVFDVFAARVRARGHGLPRRADNGQICWHAAAQDAGCKLTDLDGVSINRLLAIDAMADQPGPTVTPNEPALMRPGRTPPNPAARGLIEREIQAWGGKLPADPLDGSKVDVGAFSWNAGVASADIIDSPSNTALLAAAVARGTLLPNPIIKARAYNYASLKDFGRAARRTECHGRSAPAGAARDSTRALTQFLELTGGSSSDAVPADFDARADKAIADYDGRFGSGWMAEMRRWKAWNRAKRAEMPLPEQFSSSLRILMAEAGVTTADIRCEFGDLAMKWIDGTAIPSHRTEKKVARFAEMLNVPVERLTDLLPPEWRRHLARRGDEKVRGLSRYLPADFGDMDEDAQTELVEVTHAEKRLQKTDWALKNAEAIKDHYVVGPQAFSAEMRAALDSVMPAKKTGRKMRRPGERTVADHRQEKERRPWRQQTRDILDAHFGALLGFLGRFASPTTVELDTLIPEEETEGDGRFHSEPGLGIPHELMHPAIFAFIDLLNLWAWWNKSRNGGTVSPVVIDTIRFVMDMMKPGTGIIWKNPDFIAHMEKFLEWWNSNPPVVDHGEPIFDIEPFRQDWQAAVAAEYAQLALDVKQLSKNHVRPLRDPFEAVKVFIAERGPQGPLGLYMEGVKNLLAAKPTTVISRHVHNRDCVMAQILVQTALRANTMLLEISGPGQTLFRDVAPDGTVSWRVRIPGEKFKNYHAARFGNGRNFEFTLEDEFGLYARLDEYVNKSRPYLLAGRVSDSLFVSSQGNDFSALMVGQAYKRITRLYFVYNDQTKTGVKGATSHGPHAVRHVVATHIVVTEGDLYVAAWALQDSLVTTDRHYARFLPTDRFLIAAEVLKAARQGIQRQRDMTDVKTTVARAAHGVLSNASQRRATLAQASA